MAQDHDYFRYQADHEADTGWALETWYSWDLIIAVGIRAAPLTLSHREDQFTPA